MTPLGHCTKYLNWCVPFNVTIWDTSFLWTKFLEKTWSCSKFKCHSMVDDLFVQKIQYFVEGNRTFKGGNQKKKKDFSRKYNTSGPLYKTFKFMCAFQRNHLRHSFLWTKFLEKKSEHVVSSNVKAWLMIYLWRQSSALFLLLPNHKDPEYIVSIFNQFSLKQTRASFHEEKTLDNL